MTDRVQRSGSAVNLSVDIVKVRVAHIRIRMVRMKDITMVANRSRFGRIKVVSSFAS